ncbi:MAG TPA: hypothetical protein VHL59_13390 [Thermoanaerobaculia bacterium]|nr:hypothetical protein [Thermoanaerobaculia bacterium]
MKRLAMVLIVLFTAATLFAGEGKECNVKNAKAKSVELTGTLVRTADGDAEKTVFRVADSDQSYTVCHKSKSSALKLSNEGAVRVKGKLVSCGEGEELMIESAKKI